MEDLVELEEELEELDDAREIEIFVLEFLCEMLLIVLELVGLGRLPLDLNLGGLVEPQVLELHGVVLLGIVPLYLEHFGVDAFALPLHVGLVVAILVLAQRPLEFDIISAVESRCRVGD